MSILAAVSISFLISLLTLPIIIAYSVKKNLGAMPGRRFVHKKITPALGGIAIFAGFLLSSILLIEISHWDDLKFLFVALFVTFIIGWRDDLVAVKPTTKLIIQLIAALIILLLFELRLTGLYGILAIHEVPLLVSYALTVLTIIIITNSFNLIDGLDGLAGTISSIAFLSFGIWFYLTGHTVYAIILFAMLGGILAFLIYNWQPAKIFMGDSGALVIGIMLATTVIHFINSNAVMPEGATFKFKAPVATAACIIIIPLIDTVRVIIIRFRKRMSPIKPDKNHIHHHIMRLGMSHSQSAMLLGLIQLLYIACALICRNVGENWVLLSLLLLSIMLSVLLDWLIGRKRFVKDIRKS